MTSHGSKTIITRVVATDATDIAIIRRDCGCDGRPHYFEAGHPICMCGAERNTHCGLGGVRVVEKFP